MPSIRCILDTILLHFLLASTVRTVITLPPPLGPYKVGTKRFEVTDFNRLDPLAPTPQPRSLMLQIWYPISQSSSQIPAPWLPANAAAWADQALDMGSGTIESIVTNTWLNGTAIFPLITRFNSMLPVVVFSPGSGSLAAFYTTFTSSLASYGYIIVGVDHPYDSDPLELPNGELIHDVLNDANNTLAAEIRSADVIWLATQLTLPNIISWLDVPSDSCAVLSSKVKEIKLGIFGQSIGGTTAALAMQYSNTSYSAGASLDGPFYGPILTDGFYGPQLYMAAQNSGNHAVLVAEWPLVKGWKLAVEVNRSMHDPYTDAVVLVPQVPSDSNLALECGRYIGTINSERIIKIVTTYLKAFWGWALLGKEESHLLKYESARFPEVVFENI